MNPDRAHADQRVMVEGRPVAIALTFDGAGPTNPLIPALGAVLAQHLPSHMDLIWIWVWFLPIIRQTQICASNQ